MKQAVSVCSVNIRSAIRDPCPAQVLGEGAEHTPAIVTVKWELSFHWAAGSACAGHSPERRFPDHWHSFRGRRLPTGTSRREEPWPGRYHRSVAADGCALTGATRSRVLLKKALRLWCVRMVATDVIDWEFL